MAMARATTARVRGSSGSAARRRPAASAKDWATMRSRSWTARSTSGLSRTISGKDRSQPRSDSTDSAPEASRVPRSSRRLPEPLTKASTTSGAGGSRPTTRRSALEAKWLKTVRRETPARAATSSTVIAA